MAWSCFHQKDYKVMFQTLEKAATQTNKGDLNINFIKASVSILMGDYEEALAKLKFDEKHCKLSKD